ncbi:U4/U6 small nuclear ribonucleoprotein Prp31 homolog isoform X2 [Durio zibethinus]|uniref:U4/U6 small nuclear ribonucleoprotein Prp31 homolog isoform X2 n=1 Tax=Durio zibethinus TaxID=66656 RepID=A0A6P6BEN6_DURZI|nr:U4/U6 small nuclear ribonucleoprotein Prp31 homolog isoform X2 [Durio zibethinus]
MATLVDSFLADLDELSGNEANVLDEENDDVKIMEEDSDGDLAGFEALNYDDLDSVSKLQKTQRHIDIMQVLGKALWKQWCCLWTNFKFVFHTCAGARKGLAFRTQNRGKQFRLRLFKLLEAEVKR